MFNKQSSSLNGTVAKPESSPSPSKSKAAPSPDRASTNLDNFRNNQPAFIQSSETFSTAQADNPSSPPVPSSSQHQQFFDYHRLNQSQNFFDRHNVAQITSTMNVNVSMNFNGNAAAAVAAAAVGQAGASQSSYYQPQQNLDVYHQQNYLNNSSANTNIQQVTNSTNEQESLNQPITFPANNLGMFN